MPRVMVNTPALLEAGNSCRDAEAHLVLMAWRWQRTPIGQSGLDRGMHHAHWTVLRDFVTHLLCAVQHRHFVYLQCAVRLFSPRIPALVDYFVKHSRCSVLHR